MYTYVFQEAHGVTEIREYSRAHAPAGLGEQNMMQATELITQSSREREREREISFSRERERVRPSIGNGCCDVYQCPRIGGTFGSFVSGIHLLQVS